MGKKEKRSKLFYRYLISYVLILLIPLIGLSVFVRGYLFQVLEEEIQKNSSNNLQNAKNIVETQLDHLTSTEQKMYLNKMLRGFSLQDDTLTAIDVKDQLKAYCLLTPFLVDAVYYQEEDDYMVAASSSCLKEDFWNTMYFFENWDYESFRNDLETNTGAFFIPAQRVYVKKISYQRIVTLVVPLDTAGKRCVMLLINEDFFTNILPRPNMKEEVSAILDENGQVQVCVGEGSLLDAVSAKISEADQSSGKNIHKSIDKDIKNTDQNVNQNAEIVTIGGKKYLRSCVYSPMYRWTYETLVLIDSIEKETVYVQLLMSIICFAIIAVGAVGITYFMKQNYNPLHSLEVASNEIMKNEQNGNEIDHVKTVLNYLNQQNQKMQAEELNRKETLKERFLLRWISGYYVDREQITEQAAKADITFCNKRYQVAVLFIGRGQPEKKQKCGEILLQDIPEGMNVFVSTQAEAEKIFLVVAYDEDGDETVQNYFSRCVNAVQKETGMNCCVAIGTSVGEIERLKNSYKEALKALQYRIILDDRKIIRYEEIKDWNGNDVLDIQPRRMENYVRNRDKEGLDNFMQTSLEEIKSRKMDIRQIHMLCNEFIYALESLIDHVNRDYFIEDPLYDNVTGILEYDTVRELMELLRLILCDIIDRLEEQRDRSIKEKMIAYVAQNCFSAEFSTAAMAEKFNMSLSNLSRYFKKYMGSTLMDYVTELKINKAMELLMYGDRRIKDVAEEVGYSNVNSFVRRFKQVTGCTPGEYTQRMGKK